MKYCRCPIASKKRKLIQVCHRRKCFLAVVLKGILVEITKTKSPKMIMDWSRVVTGWSRTPFLYLVTPALGQVGYSAMTRGILDILAVV